METKWLRITVFVKINLIIICLSMANFSFAQRDIEKEPTTETIRAAKENTPNGLQGGSGKYELEVDPKGIQRTRIDHCIEDLNQLRKKITQYWQIHLWFHKAGGLFVALPTWLGKRFTCTLTKVLG